MKIETKLNKIIRDCSVCKQPFESEGLLSCPAHSFGDFAPITRDELEAKTL